MYGVRQWQYYSFKEAYTDMLREEAEKLYASLEKMLTDEVIDQHVAKTSLASFLMLPLHDDFS